MLIKFGVWEPPLSNLPESSPFCFYIMSLISLESKVRLSHRDLEGLCVRALVNPMLSFSHLLLSGYHSGFFESLWSCNN